MLFGLWALYLWIRAWFTDPGIITIYDKTESVQAQIEYSDFSSDEEKVLNTDKIYNHC
jgi:hypothetical protein